MVNEIISEMKERSQRSIDAMKKEFSHIRTGRANTSILDDVRVEQYGQQMPINQLATLTVPESRQILITPWDKGSIQPIERSLMAANLGVSVNSDGIVIRVIFPDLTEERRKEFVKLAHQKAEEGRVAVRNKRRDANDALKKMLKESEIGEDDEHRALDEIQKITDDTIKTIDHMLQTKEQEIMEI